MLRTSSPSAAPSSCALTHIPSATPACGSSVMPRYLQIAGLHFISFAL